MNTGLVMIGRICLAVIALSLAFYVALLIGHEKRIECNITGITIHKTVMHNKVSGKDTTTSCNKPQFNLQYIAAGLSYNSEANDTPENTIAVCYSDIDIQKYVKQNAANSLRTCYYDPSAPQDIHFHKTTYNELAHLTLKIGFIALLILMGTRYIGRRRKH